MKYTLQNIFAYQEDCFQLCTSHFHSLNSLREIHDHKTSRGYRYQRDLPSLSTIAAQFMFCSARTSKLLNYRVRGRKRREFEQQTLSHAIRKS